MIRTSKVLLKESTIHLKSQTKPLPNGTIKNGTPVKDTTFVGMTGGKPSRSVNIKREIFHEMMLRKEVKVIFGYPGGAILPVYDAIYNSPHFDFYLPRHEQGAGHMAEGYARITGKPGVCLVTSGPGATNVITPMQDALSDGTPMVVFSGQVPTTAIGTDAFQEADIIGISRACTKWNVMVKSIDELPRRINEAFEIATSGRPGPVLVDLPKDITAGTLTKPLTQYDSLIPGKRVTINDELSPSIMDSIEKAAKMLNHAKKPILYVGQGILNTAHGPALLKALAQKANIPVTTTLQGLGAFDELDPLSLHMLGMHGSAYANLAMQSADVIIALGARFDDRVTGNLKRKHVVAFTDRLGFAPSATRASMSNKGGIIQFEVSPKNINKVVPVDISIEACLSSSLPHFLSLVEQRSPSSWNDQVSLWKAKYPFRYMPSKEGGKMKPQYIIEELNSQTAHMKKNVIISTGVGCHQMFAAQYFRWRHPRTFVTSGGLGTMGFGLPSAIGAKIASPESIVVDIDGDASFAMTAMELMTARQYNIGVKVLILNNDFQGMVKQWQDLFYEKRYSGTVMHNPDFALLAQSMGCVGLRARTKEELPEMMERFLATEGPVLLDAVVCKEEHVYPMVPAGKALHEMELGHTKLDEPGHKFHNSLIAP